MLFITGLLTLLAIAQAGGEHIKGGSHIKGVQEKLAQEDLIHHLKTAPFGARDVVTDPQTKTAHSPSLHHAVKTAAAVKTGKSHPSTGIHHAAAVPAVAQQQVAIDDPRGVKTLKTAVAASTKTVKGRDPVARPMIQTQQQSVDDPSATAVKTVKSLKTAAGKTRFAQEDIQLRDPVARPVVQVQQAAVDSPAVSQIKTVKSVKTADATVQTVKSVDPSTGVVTKQTTVKTVKTAQSSSPRTKTVQQVVSSQGVGSGVPESIVTAARRYSLASSSSSDPSSAGPRLRTQSAAGGRVSAASVSGPDIQGGLTSGGHGGLTLDEETLKALQEAGGVVTENGEISVNSIGLEMLTSRMGGSIPQSLGSIGAGEGAPIRLNSEIISRGPGSQDWAPRLRAPELGQRQRGSSQTRRVSASGRATGSTVNTRSRSSSSQGGIGQGGPISPAAVSGPLGAPLSGSALGGIIRGPQSPVMLQPSAGVISGTSGLRIDNSLAQQQAASRRRGPARTSSGINVRTSSRVTTGSVPSGPAGSPLTSGIAQFGARGPPSSGLPTIASADTVLFNGNEINIGGMKEGQLFDENLRPISPGAAPTGDANALLTSGIAGPSGAGISTVRLSNAQGLLATGVSGAQRSSGRPGAAQGIRRTQSSTRAAQTGLRYQGAVSTARAGATVRSTPVVSPQTSRSSVPRSQPQAQRSPLRRVAGGLAGSAGIGGQGGATVLFDGKEINVEGLRAGQMFDENLKPILGGGIGAGAEMNAPAALQGIRPATRTIVRSRQQSAGIPRDNVNLRAPISSIPAQPIAGNADGVQLNLGNQIIAGVLGAPKPARRRPVSSPQAGVTAGLIRSSGAGGSTLGGGIQTVLFNGKEINIGNVREGELFDENLQRISPGVTGIQQARIRASAIPQNIKPARRPALRSQAQSVPGAPKPSQIRQGARTRRPQATIASYNQGLQMNIRRQTSNQENFPSSRIDVSSNQAAGAGLATGAGLSAGRGIQTIGPNSETVLFNGKEINIGGLREGQLFDENLQPISSGITGEIPRPDLKVSNIPQAIKPATRTVSGTRRDATRNLGSQRLPGAYRTSQQNQRRPVSGQTLAVGGITRSGGITGQTISSRSETVLFDGKEINVGGLRAGQLFDENLKPISPAISGIRPTDARAPAAAQGIKPASEAVAGLRSGAQWNLGSQRTSSGSQTRQRRPVSGQIGASGALVRSAGSTGTGGQTISTRSETVLFDGKEINVGGLRAGQLFDENLKPISPSISGTGSIGASAASQGIKPASEAVAGLRSGAQWNLGSQRISSSSQTRQRRPVSGQIGASVRSSGTAGTRGQTLSTRTETVLFDGKEINVAGLSAGQLFDENLQPISPAISGIRPTDARAPTASQGFKPAQRTVVRNQPQSLTAISGAPKPGQNKPIVRQRKPQVGITGYTQRIRPNTQSSAIPASGAVGGLSGQTIATRSDTVLFNGKEISIGNAREGQLFDENLQPISPGISGARPTDFRASAIPQSIKPATRTSVRRGQQSSTISRDSLNLRAPSAIPVGISGQSDAGTRRGIQLNLGSQGISSGTAGPKPIQTRPVAGQRRPQGSVPGGYSQAIRSNAQNLATLQGNYLSAGVSGQDVGSAGAVGGIVGPGGVTSIGSRTATINSGTVLYDGKEINIAGLQAGQLFDENLQPILQSGPESAKPIDVRTAVGPQGPSISSTSSIASRGSAAAARQRSRQAAQQRAAGAAALRQRASSGGASQANTISGGAILSNQPFEISPNVGRTTSGARLAASGLRSGQGISSPNTLGRPSLSSRPVQSPAGTGRTSLTSGTVLFNGKEINIDGLKPGQLFDENLQPVSDGRSGTLQSSGILSSTGGLRATAVTGVSQGPQLRKPGTLVSRVTASQRSRADQGVGSRSRGAASYSRQSGAALARGSLTGSTGTAGALPFPGAIMSSNEGILTGTSQDARPILGREGDLAAFHREAGSAGALDSLGYIDVTRSRGSGASSSIGSSADSISGASLYGSGGRTGSRGRISQDRISQDQVQSLILQQKQETPFLTTPDVQQRISLSDPSTKTLKAPSDPISKLSQKSLEPTDSKQTQLRIEDVLQQTSLKAPEALKTAQVQETIPFGGSPAISQKTTPTKISQVSQRDIDALSVQQKLLGGGLSEYLPKTSFLPPFNYAVPQLSQYRVKSSPIVQQQQKLEQIFV